MESAERDETAEVTPVEESAKPNKSAPLVKGQLQSEAVFSLHAALQAEYLQTKGQQIEEETAEDQTPRMAGKFIKGYHTARPLKIVQNTVGEGDIMIEMYQSGELKEMVEKAVAEAD